MYRIFYTVSACFLQCNGPVFDTVQSEYLVEYYIRFGKSICQVLNTFHNLEVNNAGFAKLLATWQKFVMENLPKFYTAKQCSIWYQVMEIYQPPPQLVETLGFS